MKYPIILFLLIKSVLISQIPIDYKLSTNNILNRYIYFTFSRVSLIGYYIIYPPFDSRNRFL